MPKLLVGNEGVAYATVVPADVEVTPYQSFSLLAPPLSDSQPIGDLFAAVGLGNGAARRVGIAGWKYFGCDEGERAETCLVSGPRLAWPARPAGRCAGATL